MPEELRTDRRQTDMEHEMQTEELPGRPDAESSVFVAVTSVDICTQQPLGSSLGFREDLGDALDLDRLDTASLAATVQIGEPSKAREHIMVDYPGFRVNSRESGTTRAADVTGVVSDGTTNYVSGAWAGGTLSSVAAGQVVILH